MNTIWILVICINSTWAGCGAQRVSEMPNKETCFEALREIRVENSATVASGEIAKNTVAYCAPKEKPKVE